MRGYSPEAQRKFEALRGGEEWAYRARHIDSFVRVEIIRTGSREPPRVLIRFLDEAFEGREEWVPPNRLNVPWADVDGFRAAEARWAAVEEASQATDAEDAAAGIVFDKLVKSDLAALIYNVEGVVRIHDVDALAVNRPDFGGDSIAWRIMESWQSTAAPVRSSGGIRPSSGSGPSGWSSRRSPSGVTGSVR